MKAALSCSAGFVCVHALSVLRVVEALCESSDAMSARFTMGASVFDTEPSSQ